MDDIFLCIAGFAIGIRFGKGEWPLFAIKAFRSAIFYTYLRFLCEKKPAKIDYWISVVQRQKFEVVIKTHKKKFYINFYEEAPNNTIITFYHISESQFQLIVRSILQKLLAKKGGIITHASASLVKGNAYIFLGKSGAGKSTITKLISTKYAKLADDMIILKQEKGRYYFYQIPFLETSFWDEPKSTKFPVGKIFFLQKAKVFNIEKIENKEYIINHFIDQFFTEKEDVAKQMDYVLKFIAECDNFYILKFGLQNIQHMVKLIEAS